MNREKFNASISHKQLANFTSFDRFQIQLRSQLVSKILLIKTLDQQQQHHECGQPIKTHKHRWSNKIELCCYWQPVSQKLQPIKIRFVVGGGYDQRNAGLMV